MNYLNFDFSTVLSFIYDICAGGLSILLIIAKWILLDKAGEPGWASIIPFYNHYCMFKVAGKVRMFWWWLGMQIASIIIYMIAFVELILLVVNGLNGIGTSHYDSTAFHGNVAFLIILGILLCIILIAEIVFSAIVAGGLAEMFGQSSGFAVGLFFLPVVFYCILAFSSKIQYAGNRQNSYGSQGYYDPYGQPNNNYNPYGQPNNGYNPYGQPNDNGYNPYGQPNNNYNSYNQPSDNTYHSYSQPSNEYNPYNQPNDNNYNPYGQQSNGYEPQDYNMNDSQNYNPVEPQEDEE